MNIEEYLKEMRDIQSALLEYFEEETNFEDNFQNLQRQLEKIKIQEDQNMFKSFLYLIINISNNFHRLPNLFDKVDEILRYFKDYIKKYYSNSEIFHIFKSNKRIILFLQEEKIITIDEYIVKRIITGKYLKAKYPQYFSPEIKIFLKEDWFPENLCLKEIINEIPENFYELRRKGENDSYICELIRKDSIDEFVQYVNKNANQITAKIKPSIYETNSYLLKKENITLIEYSLFYGSIQIFNNLRYNQIKIKSSLWLYAIHGQNPDIIHHLESYELEPEDETYEECFKESIKCHHNDIAEYIKNNKLKESSLEEEEDKDKEKEPKIEKEYLYGFRYHNYHFLPKVEEIDENHLYYLCKYDYFNIVKHLIRREKIIINQYRISKRYI